MIVLPGQNPMGNVLHVVVGPETELFTDIHGAALMDVTEFITQMEPDKPVFLSVTRCKSEPVTAAMMRGSGITHKNSFAAAGKEHASDKPLSGSSVSDVGVCQFCSRSTELIPVPKYKICVSCAQIEIGKGQFSKRAEEDLDV